MTLTTFAATEFDVASARPLFLATKSFISTECWWYGPAGSFDAFFPASLYGVFTHAYARIPGNTAFFEEPHIGFPIQFQLVYKDNDWNLTCPRQNAGRIPADAS